MANKNKIKNFKKKTKKQRGGVTPPPILSTNATPFSPKRKSINKVIPTSPSKRRSMSNSTRKLPSPSRTSLKASAVPFKFKSTTPAFNPSAPAFKPRPITRSSTFTPSPKLVPITIGTYNILFPGKVDRVLIPPNKYVYKPDGSPVGFNYRPPKANAPPDELHEDIYENSEERTEIMIANLINSDLDIICLQEVSNAKYGGNPSVYDKIINNSNLGELYTLSKLQIHPNLRYSHGVMILYKKNFKLISEASVTIPSGINDKSRMCSIVYLNYNGKKICIVSCHFYDARDYSTPKDKAIQMNSVLAEINKQTKKSDLNIIAGDFNQDQYGDLEGTTNIPIDFSEPLGPQKASVFQPLFPTEDKDKKQLYTFDNDLKPSEYTKEINENDYEDNPWAYNNPIIPKKENGKTRRIDWIFCNDKTGQVPKSIRLPKFDLRASDHSLKAVSILL
jgi:endonuclease/exonuclease/phosphatase family metal-dependent hydrolase